MIKNIFYVLFIVLILAWIMLAIARTINYSVALVLVDLPEASVGNLPREATYHKMKNLAKKLDSRPEEGDFMYSTSEGRDFFLLRYFAYPKKIYWKEEGRAPAGAYELNISK